MAIRAAVARSLFACFLTVAGGSALAPAAMAQHVVTDNEAGKLTLDALTATPVPVVRHVIAYRSVRNAWSHPAWSRAAWAEPVHGRQARAIRLVSYSRAVRVPVSVPTHYAAAHRRRRS